MQFNDFMLSIKKWAEYDENIRSVILVGSYARQEQKIDSDIDLCLLMRNPNTFIRDPFSLKRFGQIEKICEEDYGHVTSLRVFYDHDLEVEFGVTDIHWSKTPLDQGTKKVLEDGYKVIIDKDQLFENIHIKEWHNEV